MNNFASWQYHHSAKFRDKNLGQIKKKIDKYEGAGDQINDINLFNNDSEKLLDLAISKERNKIYPLKMINNIQKVSWKDNNAKNKMIDIIQNYGYCVVKTNNELDINKIINWLIPNQYPMSTMYGLVWDVIDKQDKAINLAYTNKGIELHQDLIYYSPPPTIQVLHCLEQAESGGITNVLNVYKLALEFKKKYPNEFNILKKYKTTFQKIHYNRDAPYHIVKKVEIMEHYENELIRVNWSPFLEGFTDFNKDWGEYYDAYFVWNKFIDNQNKINILLKPGEFLIFHNHHMLHGREAYCGNRHLKGFYLSSEQWINMINMN